jgi:hypothetical protein
MKKLVIFLLVPLFIFFQTACSDNNSVCYYFDAIGGDDSNNGTSSGKAWKNLEKLHGIILNPGDRVLLKRGEVFYGELEISARGIAENRIYVDAYGEGIEKPCIIGNETSLYAARIYNSDYITFRNIEIVNTGRVPTPYRTGLKIEASDYGVSNHIMVDNVTIRDVNGSLVKKEGGGCGIYIVNEGEEKISVFDKLTIENCHILRCARNAMIWRAYSDRRNWHPNTNTVIRNNLIEETPGDGIVPIGCDNTLIEYNVMRNCPDILPDGEAAAGIWPWSCDNTLIQFNEVSGHKAPWDAQGFDSDWNCSGTVIQYNYSHDNYGGMALICNSGETAAPRNIGNIGTILRYNVSINDGLRPKSTRSGMFSPAIHVAGPVKDSHIKRNIIHLNKKDADDIDRTMLVLDSWGGYPDSTFICENIFYTPEESDMKLTKSTHNVFEGNYYMGKFKELPADKNARYNAEYYMTDIVHVNDDRIEGPFKLLETKPIGHTTGQFVNKELIESFFLKITGLTPGK